MNTSAAEKGMLLVLSGPSGVGKSTMCGYFLEGRDDFEFSISATTRAPRPGEVDGKDYYFKTQEEFDRLVEEDAFIEWANNFGKCYGSLKSEVERITSSGKNVLFDVDVKGAINIMKLYPEAMTVFIYPESMEFLENRLRGRGNNTEEDILRRLAEARTEISCMDKYKYAFCNTESTVTAKLLAEAFEKESAAYHNKLEAIERLCR